MWYFRPFWLVTVKCIRKSSCCRCGLPSTWLLLRYRPFAAKVSQPANHILMMPLHRATSVCSSLLPHSTSARNSLLLQTPASHSCPLGGPLNGSCVPPLSLYMSSDLLSTTEHRKKNLSIVWTLCCSSTLKPARERSSNVQMWKSLADAIVVAPAGLDVKCTEGNIVCVADPCSPLLNPHPPLPSCQPFILFFVSSSFD